MKTHPKERQSVFTVYVDSTIPSYLVSKPSRVPRKSKWQRITREFWDDKRFEFVLSDLVITEMSIGDRTQAVDRLKAIEGLPVVLVLGLSGHWHSNSSLEKQYRR